MNTQLVTETGRHQHPPHEVHETGASETETQSTVTQTTETQFLRHVGPLDRLALHLGVALIRWGRRPIKADVSKRLAFNLETDAARREMELVRAQHLARVNRIL